MTIEDESLLKVVNEAQQKERQLKTLSYTTQIPISERGQRTPTDAEGQKQPLRQHSGIGPVYTRWKRDGTKRDHDRKDVQVGQRAVSSKAS